MGAVEGTHRLNEDVSVTSQHLSSDVSHDGMVATITLRHPPSNLLHIEMIEEINSALLALRGQAGLKVLVLRGQGDVFCGGLDLREHNRDKVGRLMQVFHRVFETMRLLEVISVAAVNGRAVGAGFELALGCNLVVASASARFSLPEVGMGVFPAVACVVLPRVSPRRKAMEWILLGESIAASELASFGLVNRVFPEGDFDVGLNGFLGQLIANSGPVMQFARRAQTESYYATYEDALYKAENFYLRDLMGLSDPHEGVRAHLEQRPPRWRNA